MSGKYVERNTVDRAKQTETKKNRIKRCGQARFRNIPTTWRWARGAKERQRKGWTEKNQKLDQPRIAGAVGGPEQTDLKEDPKHTRD